MAFFQTANLWIQELADGVAALVLDGPDDHNAMRLETVADLEAALDKLENVPRFHLLIVRSGKPYHFSIGFSPRETRSLTPSQWAELSSRGQAFCVRLSRSRLVSVAMIGGHCLGAGLELALACDYRVVVEKPTSILAFPEVEVGLVPTWGGTARLARKVGLDRAQQMILTGKKADARQAHDWGLVDRIVDDDDNEPPNFVATPTKQSPETIVRRGWRQWVLETNAAGRRFLRRGTERILRRKLPDSFAAPWEGLELVFRSLDERALDAALERERAAHGRLVADPAFRNLVDFQARRDQVRNAAVSAAHQPKIVGIVGLGSRGLGLLLQVVAKGCNAVVHESDEAGLGLGLFRIFQMFKDEVARGALSAAQLQKNLAAIRGTVSWKNFDEADVVFDTRETTVPKDADFFQDLESHTRLETLVVANSLTPDSAAMNEALEHPHRLVWTYWHEPYTRHSLVELVESPGTDEKLRGKLAEFLRFLGKTVVKSPETPGLMVHRILAPMFNEAGILLKQGAYSERIDEAIRSFGFDLGPLEKMDRMGLANVFSLLEACQPRFEGRITFESGFREMWQAGWPGKKTKGFFEYKHNRRSPNVSLNDFWQTHSDGTAAAVLPTLSHKDSIDLIQDRLVLISVAEAIRWMQEFPNTDPANLDFAFESTGWPAHRGGPIQFARDLRADLLAAKFDALRADCGPRYTLPPGWQGTINAER